MFAPLDPRKPIEVYHRDLPHWRQKGATYFVTFHTKDALPRVAIEDLQGLRAIWLSGNPPPHDTERLQELNREIARRTEYWLHQGHGSCPFGYLEHRQLLHRSLLFFHGNEEALPIRPSTPQPRVELGAFVIMPNHGHILARPLPGNDLEEWLGSVKKFVARRIPASFKISGRLWQKESHDRIVRDLKHLNNCLHYIGKNPVMAGIPPQGSHTLWMNPDWEALGWSLGMRVKG